MSSSCSRRSCKPAAISSTARSYISTYAGESTAERVSDDPEPDLATKRIKLGSFVNGGPGAAGRVVLGTVALDERVQVPASNEPPAADPVARKGTAPAQATVLPAAER